MSENNNTLNLNEWIQEIESCALSSAEQIQRIEKEKKLTDTEVVQLLNKLLEREKNPEALLGILKKLNMYRGRVPSENLVNLLLFKNMPENCRLDDYLKVRCAVATLLGNIKDQNTVVPMLYILNNKGENYKLRLSVAEALGRIGNKYAVAPLIDIVTDEEEKSVYVRESAAKALGMLGDIRALGPFVRILESKRGIIDKFTFLKEKVIEAIGKVVENNDSEEICDRHTVKVLIGSLDDESPGVRLGAIEALSELNDESVIPLIERKIFDEEEDVARGAINSLYNIRGKNYIIDLLDDDKLPGWCRDEIEMILEEENEEYDEE